MNTSEIKEHLFSLSHKGIKYDLQRIKEASGLLNEPHNTYRSFHIAGTNGKGSTCAYLESILGCMGFKTGLFTSPHIINFEERFRICGKPVTEEQWLEVYKEQQMIISDLNLTFFEAVTLMAFEIFRRNHVDWAIFETGMGGRLDATNIIRPQVSIITSISMDHMEYLGNDMLAIAGEKLGIVKENTPLVFARHPQSTVNHLAKSICQKKGSELCCISLKNADEIADTGKGMRFSRSGVSYRINLSGEYQVLNALLALEALKKAGLENSTAMVEGLRRADLPGRFHQMDLAGKKVVFDVGHNPQAAQSLVATLRTKFPGKSICFVTGIMKDKDIAGIMEKYAEVANRIILTKPDSDRAADPQILQKEIPPGYKINSCIISDVAGAVSAAISSPEQVVCICGSFFTVGDAMRYMEV